LLRERRKGWAEEGSYHRLAIGLPLPFIIIFTNHWYWFDVANVSLGINQALCWSMTVIMKVDLVGPRWRGLALGLNE
jgi:predicted MFS family arabinose efflux permease